MSAIWDKFKKDEKEATDKAPVLAKDEKKEDKKKEDKKPKKKKVKADLEKAALFESTIIQPIISENAMNQQVAGKYVFEVKGSASKPKIAQAVKALYGVEVEKVNVLRYSPRFRQFRSQFGKTKGWKKAIVTIGKGQSIDLFTEVK
jgi:large subunit ribosomal protein L23